MKIFHRPCRVSCWLLLLVTMVQGFDLKSPAAATSTTAATTNNNNMNRRAWLQQQMAAVAGVTVAAGTGSWSFADPALASGGATAGKYTTIPIAKRRYYGRVQQGVHDFVSSLCIIAHMHACTRIS